jgi:hypothetical protein
MDKDSAIVLMVRADYGYGYGAYCNVQWDYLRI